MYSVLQDSDGKTVDDWFTKKQTPLQLGNLSIISLLIAVRPLSIVFPPRESLHERKRFSFSVTVHDNLQFLGHINIKGEKEREAGEETMFMCICA